MTATRNDIIQTMHSRILILDGATGTYLQKLGLTEEDFRGNVFRDHGIPLKGCNDVLCITQPETVTKMHLDYINAGADIIETNSFNCNRFSLQDYGLEDRVYDIAKAAAVCALQACNNTSFTENINDNASQKEGKRKIIIAGSLGPTNRTASISADVNNPASRDVTFAELTETYCDAIRGLIDGGADIILVETVFDTLNAKAALKAVDIVAEEKGIQTAIQTKPASGYKNKISVQITTDNGSVKIGGTVFGDDEQRIVTMGDFKTDFKPKGRMIVFKNTDVPGVIRDVSSILASANINIADFRLGRGDGGALAVILVDQEVSKEVLAKLNALETCIWARCAEL